MAFEIPAKGRVLVEMAKQKKQSENGSPEEGRKEMFYLTMHSTHFIYGYMASDIW